MISEAKSEAIYNVIQDKIQDFIFENHPELERELVELGNEIWNQVKVILPRRKENG